MLIDFQLVEKYNKPGPRYTSYPTAPQFHAIEDIARVLPNPEDESELSLYFHIPFCNSQCWFCGCYTIITQKQERADAYIDLLEKEVALLAPYINPKRKVVQMAFGGGSPNFLSVEQIYRLGGIIRKSFNFSESAEISVELDPRRLSFEQVKAFREVGFNRASFGVQDCDPIVQKAINRIQSHELNVQAVAWLRECGFKSFNLDLIYGLPGQTEESFSRTIKQVLELQPDRFAVFSYAHVPWMKPAQKMLERAVMPTPKEKIALLVLVTEKLSEAGYFNVGMDHFAKADDELFVAQRQGTLQRNFQGYSTRAGAEIIAFGISAISQGFSCYRQNVKDMRDYEVILNDKKFPVERGYILSDEDKIRRRIISEIMCNMGFSISGISEELEIDFLEKFSSELISLVPMMKDGLLEVSPKTFRVTEKGRFFIRNIAMPFDAYLSPENTRFSKTV